MKFAFAQKSLEMEAMQAKYEYLLGCHNHLYCIKNISEETCYCCAQINQLDRKFLQAIDRLNRYWEILGELNEPETLETQRFNVFSEETLAQLTELSKYEYRDINGELTPLVTAGEMAQLMLPRGNLTPAERLAIEAHVTHTYKFLQRIPWTKHLKNIPTIAYGHHEKLDGSGYPQGLKEEEIPIQSQILTIADIYDALTASDRPYKGRLPVETTLHILRQEANKNKINRDLVEVFEQRQVFTVLGHSFAVD